MSYAHLPNALPVLMDRHGAIHCANLGPSHQSRVSDHVRCTLVQGMAFGCGACSKCFPGGPPWTSGHTVRARYVGSPS